jgi:hypothetical protein
MAQHGEAASHPGSKVMRLLEGRNHRMLKQILVGVGVVTIATPNLAGFAMLPCQSSKVDRRDH